MRSDVMGKALAIFLVMAMIATGMALIPSGVQAGAYLIKGQVLEKDTDKPISGVEVTITVNSTPPTEWTATTGADGKFSKYVDITTAYNFSIMFTKTGFDEKVMYYQSTLFNGTVANTGVTLLTPQNLITGKVIDLDTAAGVAGVKITINDSNSNFKGTAETDTQGAFSYYTNETSVNLYFSKNGYYSTSKMNVNVGPTTDIGSVSIEKIVPTPTIRVWGIVFEEGTTKTIENATVSISEGDDKWITALTNSQGYYEMLAYPGNFQVKASHGDYFTTLDSDWWSIPEKKRWDMSLEVIPTLDKILTGTVEDSTTSIGIDSADVYIHSTDGKYTGHATTNGVGDYVINFYAPPAGVSFVLEVRNEGYFTDASNTGITDTGTRDAQLDPNIQDKILRGFVFDEVNEKPIEDASVTIYSRNYTYMAAAATTSDGYYEFPINWSAWFMLVVNADGYQSEIMNIGEVVLDKHYLEVGLTPSEADVVKTTYTFDGWNTVSAAKHSIIELDNVTVRFNADRRFGMGPIGLAPNDGELTAEEVQDWADYLKNKGTEQRDTREFLTLNDTYYKLNVTSYSVTIDGAVGAISDDAVIYINSTYNYTLATPLENPDSDRLVLVLNATYDTEFMDNIYDIILPMDPAMFEMTNNITETNKVIVTGYNNPITIDPMVHEGDMETVTMTVERSRNGTAVAKIKSGLYYIVNNSADNYIAIVRQAGAGTPDTNVTFSAADSTDPIGDIAKANFTWDLGYQGKKGYGREVTHDFTSAGLANVKLSINETGGNYTETEHALKIYVDGQKPVAGISAVVTDSENITFAVAGGENILTVNEDYQIFLSGNKFDEVEGMDDEVVAGTASHDPMIGDMDGIIEKWYWSWGEDESFDETITMEGSNNITHVYNTPGTYFMNLTVTDVIGHESDNVTWKVIVRDVTAPIVDFNIKNAEGAVVTEVIENKTFQYNASLTTDNFDAFEDLADNRFEWAFDENGTITKFTGKTVNYTFDKVGMFNVTLTVFDNSNNSANKTTMVYSNLGKRPNIVMKLGSMRFSSDTGTAGKKMTIYVNITNDGLENATNVQTTFYIRNPDGTDKEIGKTDPISVAIGNTTTVSITWSPGKKGEYSIWAEASCPGEHSSQYWDNKIQDFSETSSQRFTVKEAGWIMPVIIVAVVVVIVAVFFGMKYFMKSGTKEDDTGEKRKKR